MKCKCFLFDLDGTLIDSLPVSEKIWTQWAVEHRCDANEVLNYIHGRQAIESLRYFLKGNTEEHITQEWLDLENKECAEVDSITALPGVFKILDFLNENKIPWAIVTSGTSKLATARHKAAQLPQPNLFITAENVRKSKPHPEPYLLAAKTLGFTPDQCVVFEDALTGIQSAIQATCQVIAINSHIDKITNDISLQVESLDELELNYLGDGCVRITQIR
jgi:haloacid dehalogenase superfamily, subfamily IA, variant 3 with third motif having DD or ED